jgi:4-hydroxybenzoate polyprenyltransferase
MLGLISQRILSILQLTRMALVFTAISNGACEVLLQAGYNARENHVTFLQALDVKTLFAMAAVSVGLYGFGMSLNDIIDRRRDSRMAAHRPLPSGRIGVIPAYAVCACLALLAAWGGAVYAHWAFPRDPEDPVPCFAMVIITGLLIVFYDVAGKYLVPLGLVSLGMIRYLQASIAAPLLPIVWHPLLLANHVTILSTIAYHWEQKRPPLTRKAMYVVGTGLLLINLATISFFGWHLSDGTLHGLLRDLEFNRSLLPVLPTIPAFVLVAIWIKKTNSVPSEAGQKLMLYGLLWLIIYDSAFVAGYVSWAAAGLLLCLLPIAWWSVQLMRWWSKVYSLSQRPVFQRARN